LNSLCTVCLLDKLEASATSLLVNGRQLSVEHYQLILIQAFSFGFAS